VGSGRERIYKEMIKRERKRTKGKIHVHLSRKFCMDWRSLLEKVFLQEVSRFIEEADR
jgi:hypothetical protein